MQGIATVAAVDCDDKGNQQLCGEYGVQGFPTLKACCASCFGIFEHLQWFYSRA